jgi:hypothetical protein
MAFEPRARALTASERSSLSPRRAPSLVCDICGEELKIDSRLLKRYVRIQCGVPGSENTLACLRQVILDASKGVSQCVIKTHRVPSH